MGIGAIRFRPYHRLCYVTVSWLRMGRVEGRLFSSSDCCGLFGEQCLQMSRLNVGGVYLFGLIEIPASNGRWYMRLDRADLVDDVAGASLTGEWWLNEQLRLLCVCVRAFTKTESEIPSDFIGIME